MGGAKRYPSCLSKAVVDFAESSTHPTAPGLRQNNPTGKISLNASGKSALSVRPSHPAGGAYRDRHETRDGMRWTRQRRRARRSQGEQNSWAVDRTQDDGAGCVRQNRVVPTPVAGVKLSVAKSIRPGRSAAKPAATVTRRIRRRGERGISRKTIAQGMPDCLRWTCMLVCVFWCTTLRTRPRVQRASGIPCSLFLSRGQRNANLGHNRAARRRTCIWCLKLNPKCIRVIASAAKQSIVTKQRKNGLLRCARN